jgi:hypothetical protein
MKAPININANLITLKDTLRAQLAAQIAEFLARRAV